MYKKIFTMVAAVLFLVGLSITSVMAEARTRGLWVINKTDKDFSIHAEISGKPNKSLGMLYAGQKRFFKNKSGDHTMIVFERGFLRKNLRSFQHFESDSSGLEVHSVVIMKKGGKYIAAKDKEGGEVLVSAKANARGIWVINKTNENLGLHSECWGTPNITYGKLDAGQKRFVGVNADSVMLVFERGFLRKNLRAFQVFDSNRSDSEVYTAIVTKEGGKYDIPISTGTAE